MFIKPLAIMQVGVRSEHGCHGLRERVFVQDGVFVRLKGELLVVRGELERENHQCKGGECEV